MKIVFMGTPSFALPTLKALFAAPNREILAVFTRPDSRSGRGSALYPSPVKQCALKLGIDVYTPATLVDDKTIEGIRQLAPDIIVVCAYGALLAQDILDIAALGCLNVHASLLPRWRGAAPIQRAILSGDDTTGVCVMQMQAQLDTGPYHTVGSVEIGSKTTQELSVQLAEMGAHGMLDALAGIEDGTYVWENQDETKVTYANKVDKDECLLYPQLTAHEFLRRVQASTSHTPARCMICAKEIIVVSAKQSDEVLDEGEVYLEKHKIALGVKEGAVQLVRVKPAGKRAMDAKAWVCGLHNADPVWSSVSERSHTGGT